MSEVSHEKVAFSSESQFSLVVETAMSVISQIILAKKGTHYNKAQNALVDLLIRRTRSGNFEIPTQSGTCTHST